MIEKLRSVKIDIFDAKVAVFDLAGSLILGYFIASKLKINPFIGAMSTIPLGFIVHEIVGIKTPLNMEIKNKIKNKIKVI